MLGFSLGQTQGQVDGSYSDMAKLPQEGFKSGPKPSLAAILNFNAPFSKV